MAVYTIPLFWHIHAEPWDYYRFTEFGIRHLFEKVGFEILELRAMSGFWVTFATMFCYYIGRFHRSVLRFFPSKILIDRATTLANDSQERVLIDDLGAELLRLLGLR